MSKLCSFNEFVSSMEKPPVLNRIDNQNISSSLEAREKYLLDMVERVGKNLTLPKKAKLMFDLARVLGFRNFGQINQVLGWMRAGAKNGEFQAGPNLATPDE